MSRDHSVELVYPRRARPRRRQLLRPRRTSLGERGAAPRQHLGIGDRLPLPPRLGLVQREGRGAAPSPPTPAARQAAERRADLRQLAAQPRVLLGEPSATM